MDFPIVELMDPRACYQVVLNLLHPGGLPKEGRRHAAVSHVRYEWARDDDGDGVREVHCNTLEGLWTGLRNFLRPFSGV